MTGATAAAPRPAGDRPVLAGSGPAPFADRVLVEVTAFVCLSALVVLQWSRLVTDAPGGRLLAVVGIAAAAALLLSALGRAGLPRPIAALAALAIGAGALAATLLAVGIPARLLEPAHWGELRDELSFGFAGVEQTDLPYGGNDEWLRLALLSAGGALVATSALLAFWPGARRERRRLVALIVLVGAFGVAVALKAPAAELAWGAVLLLCIVAWVWGPRLARGQAARAATTAVAAGALALPLAATLDPDAPWWDYESWDWFGSERAVNFDWDHSYGPLDWPQEGTKLLEVHAAQPLYWKTAVLDRFDGFTWQRARQTDVSATQEQKARRAIPGDNLPDRHEEWLRQASFDVRALASPFVVGAGATQGVQGIDGTQVNPDGTVRKFGAPVEAGDEYSIVAYVPDPTVEELREAPREYPPRLRSQVLVGLPLPAATATPGESPELGSLSPLEGQPMALWGTRDPRVDELAESSAYRDVYRLAHSLTADARTPYDAVIAVQRHLRRNYAYNPDVPRASYPLQAFLFEQREGYCQQFSGAMALMLRMVGIPSRVATGFAPGTLDEGRDVYAVHDTDAHSWVEVYFRGIGWVTFDPTPAAAPAISQSLNELAAFRGVDPTRAQGRLGELRGDGSPVAPSPPDAESAGGGLPWGLIGLGVLAVATPAAAAYALAGWRRRRAFLGSDTAEAQLDELLEALRRLGWGLPPRATLLALERRFRSAGRPAVSAYAAGLRAHRFAPGGAAPPGPAARRELRRTLSRGGGLRRRLRGLAAIPVGGPRRRR